ncbi:carbohydrate ABC transporter permease [Phototrophicus methaneseepsis]|uniref:Carbohydrate ABC transporter permease n=1 Tax=Phototrophicus methaneseepsis TaxID=2710758 RepID=A0A7S8IF89_9CHLR|nr:carbohydrate ABC transporter permease [Phototrophicus methaneseepsis]QPC83356.1 carbohydrate ABC transporter permease [Phototrophicus methaneseepsis]
MTIKWRDLSLTLLTYIIAILIFFPILWMVLTSFKTEADAFAFPPQLFFEPTLNNWRTALFDTPFLEHLINTLIITIGSTLLAISFGIPAAYALAYYPTKRSDFTLLWLMSTRMLPPVGIIIPIFIIFRDLGLRDTHLGLIIMYTAMNLPLVVWMMRSFFLDVPYEVLEAARIDGVSLWQEFRYVAVPLVMPGLFATLLLCMIFAWNEFFFAFNLTVTDAAPVSVYISSFKTAEGLFWAKMSAAATASVLPVVIAGWFAQRQLVQGLTMGAVK